MAIKTIAVLFFHTMERDDISFCEKLEPLGYRVIRVGTIPNETSYKVTERKVGERILKEADISLEEAIQRESFDLLVIPSGPGSAGVENVDGVKALVRLSKKVVVFGWGISLLASTGELAGKNATADDHFFFGVGLSRWGDTNWQREPPFVVDDKFITAKSSQHAAILPLLAPNASLTPEATTPAAPHPIDEIAPSDLTPWQDLVKRVRDNALHLVETGGVTVDSSVQESDPFLRPAASEESIASAETRLGYPLPGEYKDFLRVSNGTGFSGDTSIPGLVIVDELNWQSTEMAETGLDSLSDLVDVPGLEEVQPQERAAMPALQRVLVISDPDDDVIVGMFDPAYIRLASQAICELRGLEWEEPESPQWITFMFVPYAASFEQYSSFKEYMESRSTTA